MQNFLADGVAVVGRYQSPAAKHMQRIGKIVDLGQIGGDQDDSGSIAQQLSEQLIDLCLGPDIDTDGGLIKNEKLRPVIEPFTNNILLRVATR